ncbi:MAG: hypothetical protein IBJ11_09760 [Phycisphaerales bacterium]|nr:hypothetical protein [Phycisphaerales bacterium]
MNRTLGSSTLGVILTIAGLGAAAVGGYAMMTGQSLCSLMGSCGTKADTASTTTLVADSATDHDSCNHDHASCSGKAVAKADTCSAKAAVASCGDKPVAKSGCGDSAANLAAQPAAGRWVRGVLASFGPAAGIPVWIPAAADLSADASDSAADDCSAAKPACRDASAKTGCGEKVAERN